MDEQYGDLDDKLNFVFSVKCASKKIATCCLNEEEAVCSVGSIVW